MLNKILNLFKKEKEEPPSALTDYSGMLVDFHNHVLPGIDDGSRNIDDSITMLRNFEQLGIKKVVASPHSMADGYINSNEKILQTRDMVQQAIDKAGINIQFAAAAEYYMDELFMEKIEKKDLLTVGKNYVLMELSYLSKPNNTGDAIYKLQVAGYNLILAHPERYPYYYEDSFENYKKFKDRGVYFQINLGSLVGKYGGAAKYTAEKMIDEGIVEFASSDLHNIGQFETLRQCLQSKHLEKLFNSDRFKNKTLL
ncbi:MAG TPA: CpsB/CapC family capsule biosynthesis tyrosine phosphatase [Chitinophagales bacterium]|nr:CpsB/CapC family capsule biosynthesis tyrosine phosphatase [Chitinophagales bacterium]